MNFQYSSSKHLSPVVIMRLFVWFMRLASASLCNEFKGHVTSFFSMWPHFMMIHSIFISGEDFLAKDINQKPWAPKQRHFYSKFRICHKHGKFFLEEVFYLNLNFYKIFVWEPTLVVWFTYWHPWTQWSWTEHVLATKIVFWEMLSM